MLRLYAEIFGEEVRAGFGGYQPLGVLRYAQDDLPLRRTITFGGCSSIFLHGILEVDHLVAPWSAGCR